MRWSEERILTTHAGSLPRPPELVRLYARRARDEAVLEVAGRAALHWVVHKQIAAWVVWAKLRALADGARLASERLF